MFCCIMPNMRQQNPQQLVNSNINYNWILKSTRWYLLYQSFSIHYSNILSGKNCLMLELMQPAPEVHFPKYLFRQRLLQKQKFTMWQTCPPTGLSDLSSVSPMLRLKSPPGILLIETTLWPSWTERYMVSVWMSWCSSWRKSQSAWLIFILVSRQLAFCISG